MSNQIVQSIGATLRRKLSRCVPKRLRRDERGAVAVEFALVAIPFFGLIFIIIQIALVFLADQLLESAVADAARSIRTGQAATNSQTVGQFRTNICNELYLLFNCNGLYVNVQTAATFSAMSLATPIDPTTKTFPTTDTYTNGAASTLMIVRVYYKFPVMFANFGMNLADQADGTRLLGAVVAFRTEPYS